MKRLLTSLAVATVALLVLSSPLWAANPAPTTITIPDMDCGGCAKTVIAKLKSVPGVADAKASVEARTVTVIAKGQEVLSPRALWEACEAAKFKPTKLEGPSGRFTSKPKS